MKKVAVIGCGSYMNSGYGCPGEWRCLKAASLGEGNFDEPSQVVAFVKCECPGRTIFPNTNLSMKMSQIQPDLIYLSSCMANAVPKCPYNDVDDIVKLLEDKTGIKVIKGTHDYH